ncbi:MAG TPA: OmpA family protein [Novosphingobium sp.]|jgi:outer membrane protein OmpA-like peptidoglycan-associated protein|nr:OmpA family protein [Novosphingobium sp.]HOA49412.1 OmpA family protein [Novosphingobium sp.]HPB23301.1 OmpA family protein [Novosphingobium sp.]HQN53679.1 OmpA family protein [Novosphingobium sp.]
MRTISHRSGAGLLIATLALPLSAGLNAQTPEAAPANIVVNAERPPAVAEMTAGPEIKGVITARSGDRMKVTAADGTSTVITLIDATRIKSSSGLFSGSRGNLGADSLLNGLPVSVKTLQWSGGLVANQVSLKKGDLKIASMIQTGTAQKFEEQTAATQALRGRMGDIDKYNVKATTNVYFDTGKAVLSPQAKQELCNTATQAGSMDNALLLVVGYTDAVGSEEYNQTLSEKRAGSVINYLQQACRWQPYRVLTPTGMSESDPVASNDTEEGKAQNRRVSVNVLVSKAVDVM